MSESTTEAERKRWGLGDGILRARIRTLVNELEALEAENERLRGEVAEYVAQSERRQANSLRRLP